MTPLPGVYEAKCVGFESATGLTVLIPQIFGTDPVPAFFLDAAPEVGARGFVSFISGQAEYPVWMGAVGRKE
jgi:hypothetical protein